MFRRTKTLGRKKKKYKIPSITPMSPSDSFGVRFDLEEDAEKLFLEHLNNTDVDHIIEEKELGVKKKAPAKARKVKTSPYRLDLHGHTVDEAIQAVDQFIELRSLAEVTNLKIRVITGKGRHSGPAGGILSREIYDYVHKFYRDRILKIDPPPFESQFNGLPLKGFFDVELKK